MRVIRRYRFNIKAKIPFAQWPEIVHRFLAENGLTYQRFMYHFSDNVHEPEVRPKACERLQKDCPEIGESRLMPTVVPTLSEWVLTNIDRDGGFREEQLLPLMSKIHRSYGFAQAALYYYDMDFFGSVVPFEREGELDSHRWQLHGSGITLYRDAVFGDAFLDMDIDVLRDGQLRDAALCCEAMQRLLPKIKVESSLKIVLTEAERQQVETVNQAAEPVLEKCKAFFAQRLPDGLRQNLTGPSYSLATALKKLARKHGYTYGTKPGSGTTCILQRQTARGNVLHIWVDAGPSHRRTDVRVSFKGVGFSHLLGAADYAPANQAELETALGQAMDFVAEFERTLLPELDAMFPECPVRFDAAAYS